MKRFLIVLVVLVMFPVSVYADEYSSTISNFDLSVFEQNMDKESYELLKELGIENFDYNSITSLSLKKLFQIVKKYITLQAQTPIKSCAIILVFILLSSLLQEIKLGDDGFSDIYSSASTLVIIILIMTRIGDVVSLSQVVIGIASKFVYAFVPVFAAIVVASGGIATSFSTNSLLLALSQGLSILSSTLFMPVINCFLALGICSSLRYELHLDKMLKSVRKIITKSISFLSAAFVSILSIKTSVASKTDAIGLRSMRFAINSVVPVIGSAISEGLLSIQSYSSLIKSSVGVVGIIAVALIFLPSICGTVVWRIGLNCCKIVADTFGDRNVSMALNAFIDGLLLINVVLILSMVTTIISIGILIAAGG